MQLSGIYSVQQLTQRMHDTQYSDFEFFFDITKSAFIRNQEIKKLFEKISDIATLSLYECIP